MNKQITHMKGFLSCLMKPLRFHMIPYHLQYETRDCTLTPVTIVSQGTIDNRNKYIKEFNPYLKSNVSYNLDDKLKDLDDKLKDLDDKLKDLDDKLKDLDDKLKDLE